MTVIARALTSSFLFSSLLNSNFNILLDRSDCVILIHLSNTFICHLHTSPMSLLSDHRNNFFKVHVYLKEGTNSLIKFRVAIAT